MLINGQHETQISSLDRGLHYGDGLFETLAIINGAPCLWRQHIRRLQLGCSRLNIRCPDPDLLLDEVRQVAAGQARAVIKLIVTRGAGGRGYLADSAAEPTRIVHLSPWPDRDEAACAQGVNVRTCSTRLSENPGLAGIKHLNRLEHVLARNEWRDPTIHEGLMLDTAGKVIEGTMSNLFLVNNGRISTPDLRSSGIAGVMREQVIQLCREKGIPVKVRDIRPQQLWDSEALFLTNSLIGIWPVATLDGQLFDPHAIDPALIKDVMERRFCNE